jgi:hypothetical protein
MSGLLYLFIFCDIKLRDLDMSAQKFGGKSKSYKTTHGLLDRIKIKNSAFKVFHVY